MYIRGGAEIGIESGGSACIYPILCRELGLLMNLRMKAVDIRPPARLAQKALCIVSMDRVDTMS